jgi:hypothetical protein
LEPELPGDYTLWEVKTVSQELPAAKPEDDWDSIEDARLITWDVPKVVEGIYQGTREIAGRFGRVNRHAIVVDGVETAFFAPVVLQQLLSSPRIRPGSFIQIEYLGTSRLSKDGRSVKNFILRVRREAKAL